MFTVTADTNIYISGFVFAGVRRQFLLAAEAGRFKLAVSEALLNELRGVLVEKFAWPAAETSEAIAQLLGCATLVQVTQTFNVVPDDPDDNRVIECAVASGSQFIVTGDGDLLRLNSYQNIRILKATEFLMLLELPEAPSR